MIGRVGRYRSCYDVDDGIIVSSSQSNYLILLFQMGFRVGVVHMLRQTVLS